MAIREVPPGTFSFSVVKTALPFGTFCPCNRALAILSCAVCDQALCQDCFDHHVCVPRKTEGRFAGEPIRPACRSCGRALWAKESVERGICGLCEIRRVP